MKINLSSTISRSACVSPTRPGTKESGNMGRMQIGSWNKTLNTLFVCATAALLCACGGGGDSGISGGESPAAADVVAFKAKSKTARYSVTDLGTVDGTSRYATFGLGINNKGQVTGTSRTEIDDRAVLYSGGTLQNLGTLGGRFSGGYGINEAGQVTGYSYLATGEQHAFLYSDGTMQDLGSLGGTYSYSFGLGINDKGQVTGDSASGVDGYQHAFLYGDGTMQDLGTLGGSYSSGSGINNKGQVTGTSYLTGDPVYYVFMRYHDGVPVYFASPIYHAFLYRHGSMRDLGTIGGNLSSGSGINNNGQVTGGGSLAGDTVFHAFLYGNGTMRDLGTLGGNSFGRGINDKGQVTGYFDSAANTGGHAFVYSDGVMQDLNDLLGESGAGWVLSEGSAINNAGQITGIGYFNGQQRAFLLTPSCVDEKADHQSPHDERHHDEHYGGQQPCAEERR